MPREVTAMLGVAALIGLTLLAWRVHQRLRALRVSSFVEVDLVDAQNSTVRMPDGSLARIHREVAVGTHVLVSPHVLNAHEAYRENARPTIRDFVASDANKDETLARWRREASTADAMALVVVGWLAMPAFVAWQHGHIVSPW